MKLKSLSSLVAEFYIFNLIGNYNFGKYNSSYKNYRSQTLNILVNSISDILSQGIIDFISKSECGSANELIKLMSKDLLKFYQQSLIILKGCKSRNKDYYISLTQYMIKILESKGFDEKSKWLELIFEVEHSTMILFQTIDPLVKSVLDIKRSNMKPEEMLYSLLQLTDGGIKKFVGLYLYQTKKIGLDLLRNHVQKLKSKEGRYYFISESTTEIEYFETSWFKKYDLPKLKLRHINQFVIDYVSNSSDFKTFIANLKSIKDINIQVNKLSGFMNHNVKIDSVTYLKHYLELENSFNGVREIVNIFLINTEIISSFNNLRSAYKITLMLKDNFPNIKVDKSFQKLYTTKDGLYISSTYIYNSSFKNYTKKFNLF